MGENYDGRAAGKPAHIVLQPGELIFTQKSQPALGDPKHVNEADEMDAAPIEAEPAAAFRAFAVAREKFLAVVADHVVLAGDVEYAANPGGFEQLIQRVEFSWFGKVRQIARVQNKIRAVGQGIDAGNGPFERAGDIRISRFVETDEAVADLEEAKIAHRGFRRR